LYLIRQPVVSRQVSFVDSRQIYPKDQADPEKERPDNWSSTALITFPLQEWLHERVTMLRYTHIAYTVGMFRVLMY
jgi:hypothetical protein